MIETGNRFGDVLYERGEAGFDAAWAVLIRRGYEPGDWMYMHSRPAHGGAPESHYFKHRLTREYIVLDAPTRLVIG